MAEEDNEFNHLHGQALRTVLSQLTLCVIANGDKAAEQKRALDFANERNQGLKKNIDDYQKYIEVLKRSISNMIEEDTNPEVLEEEKKEHAVLNLKKIKHD